MNQCGLIHDFSPRKQSAISSIPCDESKNSSFICEVQADRAGEYTKISPSITYQKYICKKGWLLYHAKCLKLLKMKVVHPLCPLLGAFNLLEDDVGTLKPLYRYTYMTIRTPCIIGHRVNSRGFNEQLFPIYHDRETYSDPSVWSQDTLVNVEKYDRIHNFSHLCVDYWLAYCYVSPSDVQSTVRYDLLQSDILFQCRDGQYIWSEYRCDGQNDCSAGEDELDCVNPCIGSDDCSMCTECSCKLEYFHCFSKECIDIGRTCDGKNDCRDGSDELSCQSVSCAENEFQCNDGACIPQTSVCDGQAQCLHGEDESQCSSSHQCSGFQCRSGECIPLARVNNLLVDCASGEDEAEYIWLATDTYFFLNSSCPSNMMPCYPGHSKCFPIDKACIYDTEPDYTITPCANGWHLKFCEDMDCPATTFKCPQSYCVPLHKICDDVIDCPDGEDEEACPLKSCPKGFYKCKGGITCFDGTALCDGQVHCSLHGDDETLCHMKHCPQDFHCSFHQISFVEPHSQTEINHIESLEKYVSTWGKETTFLDLSKMRLVSVHSITVHTLQLRYLDATLNSVTTDSLLRLCKTKLVFLRVFLLQNNAISELPANIFQFMPNLKHLDVSFNQLFKLKMDIFSGYNSLDFVNVAHNFLVEINFETQLEIVLEIQLMNISRNDLLMPQVDIIRARVAVAALITDKEEICCQISSPQNCGITKKDRSQDACKQMLSGMLHRRLYWCLGTLVVLGSGSVLFAQTIARMTRRKRRKQSSASWIQVNLALADGLLGIYLLATAVINDRMYTVYPLVKAEWKAGLQCTVLRIVKFFSPTQSSFLIILRSYHLVMGVLGTKSRQSDPKVNIAIVLGWLTNLMISAIMYEIFSSHGNLLPHDLCNNYQLWWDIDDFFNIQALSYSLCLALAGIANISHTVSNCAIARKMVTARRASKRSVSLSSEKSFFTQMILTMLFRIPHLVLLIIIHLDRNFGNPMMADYAMALNANFNALMALLQQILPLVYKGLSAK